MLAGQAQKEFFINQAFAMIDALLAMSVEASLSTPPTSPTEGFCYRVVGPGAQDWADRDDHIAFQIGGAWHFAAPIEGMRIFDRDAGVSLRFRSGWQSAAEPGAVSGGTVVDVEARQGLSELTEALRIAGIFPETG